MQGIGTQDKAKEIAFFDNHANADAYDVFTPASNARLIDSFMAATDARAGERVADLGCGSGVFTKLLKARGLNAVGVDLSGGLLARAKQAAPGIDFVVGDVETLPFADGSLDHVLLSGLVHHLPDPAQCAREVARVLRPGGRFLAFDPNRMNPFMYLYRDRSSPFYSSVGVTENERPVLAGPTADTFRAAGLAVETGYLSGLAYRYVASGLIRHVLFLYNAIDSLAFRPAPLRRFSAFVLTHGEKP